MLGPDPNRIYPNENIKQVVYIKNVITRPNIEVGDYTYYDDVNGAENFQEHVTHHYEFLGDKLIIGKFCAIGRGIEFVMNGANHRMKSVTTYPFNIMGGGWEKFAPPLEDLPLKGDTVVGNDVCNGDAGGAYRRWCHYRRRFRGDEGHPALLRCRRESLQGDPAAL